MPESFGWPEPAREWWSDAAEATYSADNWWSDNLELARMQRLTRTARPDQASAVLTRLAPPCDLCGLRSTSVEPFPVPGLGPDTCRDCRDARGLPTSITGGGFDAGEDPEPARPPRVRPDSDEDRFRAAGRCLVGTNTGDPGYRSGAVDRVHCGAPLAGALSRVVDVDGQGRETRRTVRYCARHLRDVADADPSARQVIEDPPGMLSLPARVPANEAADRLMPTD